MFYFVPWFAINKIVILLVYAEIGSPEAAEFDNYIVTMPLFVWSWFDRVWIIDWLNLWGF